MSCMQWIQQAPGLFRVRAPGIGRICTSPPTVPPVQVFCIVAFDQRGAGQSVGKKEFNTTEKLVQE